MNDKQQRAVVAMCLAVSPIAGWHRCPETGEAVVTVRGVEVARHPWPMA